VFTVQVFTVQSVYSTECLQYRVFTVQVFKYRVFTVQVYKPVSRCLQYKLYKPVSMGVYSTGCTSLFVLTSWLLILASSVFVIFYSSSCFLSFYQTANIPILKLCVGA
jgi:hypothetical protein